MATYVPLQSVVLTSTSSSVNFTGIDQSYTDLILVTSQGNDQNADYDVYVRFNSDSGTNYSRTNLMGSGSTASSSSTANNTELRIGPSINNTPTSTITFNLMSYSNTTTNKTILMRSGHASAYTVGQVGLWRNTAAITSISLTLQNGHSFVVGTTFDLYGIKSGAPQAFGGDTVTTDGNYWIHTFTSTGTFTPLRNLSCEYLVVAGGGGGGANQGKGAGAGGYRSSVVGESSGGGASAESKASLASSVAYTVTVGAGGAGGGNGSSPLCGIQGVNSSISGSGLSTITSLGGGGGGAASSAANFATWDAGGKNGGSGGANTGLGTAGQGYNSGGQSGGGAGAAGGNNVTSAGGIGVASSITGSSVYRAGGGTGYENTVGTTGGGGAGSTSGTVNTGGGGGPWNGAGSAGNGGSGVVIVRYPV